MATPDIMETLRRAVEDATSKVQQQVTQAKAELEAERAAAKAARADAAALRRKLSDYEAETDKALKKARRTIAELERELGHKPESKRDLKPEKKSDSTATSAPSDDVPWKQYTRTDSFEFLEVQGRRAMTAEFETFMHLRLFEIAADPSEISWRDVHAIANRFNVRYKRVLDTFKGRLPAGYEHLNDDVPEWRRRRVVPALAPDVRARFDEYERVVARLEPLRRFLAIVHDPMPHTNEEVVAAIDDLAEISEMYPELAAVGPDACLAADLATEAQALACAVAKRIDHTLAAAVAMEPMLSRVEVHYTFDNTRVVDLNGPTDAEIKRTKRAGTNHTTPTDAVDTDEKETA
jgi:hypothetical protein